MREIKTIELSDFKVDIITYLNWGEKETITEVLIKGAKINSTGFQEYDPSVLRESKYVLLELAIKKIVDKDGKELSFTREWMDGLSAENGDIIYNAVDELNKKKVQTTI